MSELSLPELQESRAALEVAAQELWAVQELVMSGESEVIDRHAIAMAEVLKLKQSYELQVNEYAVTLEDGRFLDRDQYQALQGFASNNRLTLEGLLPRVTIEGGVVIRCDFERCRLQTLDSLGEVHSIKSLNLSHNFNLTSLKGLPLQQLENLEVGWCGLHGNLVELQGAVRLQSLCISSNPITSLDGLPVGTLEELLAVSCRLLGDLSELRTANRLRALVVTENSNLTSLKGLSMESIEILWASSCGLTGDHTFLSQAEHLRKLDVTRNSALTLDKAQFASTTEIEW